MLQTQWCGPAVEELCIFRGWVLLKKIRKKGRVGRKGDKPELVDPPTVTTTRIFLGDVYQGSVNSSYVMLEGQRRY